MGLPVSQGKTFFMVVVDRLTKYAHFLPLSTPLTASKVVQVFTKEIVRLHYVPSSIISDRDPLFLSHFWQEFQK